MADYGFEIFSSSGQLLHSSDDYGWVVLDHWWQQPVVIGTPFNRTWVIPNEFTDFKLFAGGVSGGGIDGNITHGAVANDRTSDLSYEALSTSVVVGTNTTTISVDLRVIELGGIDERRPRNITYGVLVGR